MAGTVRRLSVGLLAALVLAAPVLAGCATPGVAAASESERSGWAGTPADLDMSQVAAGRIIAQRECASCHAIDATSVSKDLSAPPLREVLGVMDPDFLAYRLIDAMRVGHDDMPLFDFDVQSADALVAYIRSISQ